MQGEVSTCVLLFQLPIPIKPINFRGAGQGRASGRLQSLTHSSALDGLLLPCLMENFPVAERVDFFSYIQLHLILVLCSGVITDRLKEPHEVLGIKPELTMC